MYLCLTQLLHYNPAFLFQQSIKKVPLQVLEYEENIHVERYLNIYVYVSAGMAEFDLSLSDALTDGIPQSGSESLVQQDFVAQLEAESFDDHVGETVVKMDYIPLLDNDDTRAGATIEIYAPHTHTHVVILVICIYH